MDMKIVVLATPGPSTDVLVNRLHDAGYDHVTVILEPRQSRRALLRHRWRRLGWLAVAGQVLFMLTVPPLLQARAAGRRAEILRQHGLRTEPIPPELCRRVDNVNSPETIALLRTIDPAAIVLNGTRIVKAAVLQATGAPVINIHAGITPYYRGVHGGYWALWNGEPEAFGATLHLVDEGVDTGAVLHHAYILPQRDDNFVTYPLLQQAAALPALVAALAQMRDGRWMPPPQSAAGAGRQWYHPTLMQYLRGLLRGVR